MKKQNNFTLAQKETIEREATTIEAIKANCNNKVIAEVLKSCPGQIYELSKKPVEGQVYHLADINAIEILSFAKRQVMLDKFGIVEDNQEEIYNQLLVDLVEALANGDTTRARQMFEVGDKVKDKETNKNGQVLAVNQINKSYVYVVMFEDNSFKSCKSTELEKVSC